MNPDIENILIVDDDSFQRSAIRIKLQMHGYEVNEARNGTEAIDFLKQQDYSIVLLDIVMPNFNGWEVLDKIREMPNKADLPVIMMTASDTKYDLKAAKERGATDYLTKPIDFAALDKKFATYLNTGEPDSADGEELENDDSDNPDHADTLTNPIVAMDLSVLEGLTNNLPGVIFRAIADEHYKVHVTYQSSGLESFLGCQWDNVADIVSNSDSHSRKQINKAFREHAKDLNAIRIKFPCRTPKGYIGWVECRATPHRLPSGETVWDALLLDITQQQELALELDHRKSLNNDIDPYALTSLLLLYREHMVAIQQGKPVDGLLSRIDETERSLEDVLESMMSTMPDMTIEDVQSTDDTAIFESISKDQLTEVAFNEDDYRDKTGFIHQCSKCRKTRNFERGLWVTVAEWSDQMPLNTSHTICPECETVTTRIPDRTT